MGKDQGNGVVEAGVAVYDHALHRADHTSQPAAPEPISSSGYPTLTRQTLPTSRTGAVQYDR